MSRKILFAGAAAALLGAVALPALADNIVQGTWYSAQFGELLSGTLPSPVFGPGSAPGTNPSGVLAPTGSSWTITLTSPEELTVVDVQEAGDQFSVSDNGHSLGNTSDPVVDGAYVGECINCALLNTDFSVGHFFLGAGVNDITMEYLGVVGDGNLDFYVGAPQFGTPEPATWALMLVGFAGLGAALRGSRQRRAASLA